MNKLDSRYLSGETTYQVKEIEAGFAVFNKRNRQVTTCQSKRDFAFYDLIDLILDDNRGIKLIPEKEDEQCDTSSLT